jgi:hypothetical protein
MDQDAVNSLHRRDFPEYTHLYFHEDPNAPGFDFTIRVTPPPATRFPFSSDYLSSFQSAILNFQDDWINLSTR